MSKDLLKDNAQAVLHAVINNMEDVIAVFDAELNYLTVNDAACQLLKKNKHELVGKNLLDIFPNLTASDSHRQLLHAVSGETVLGVLSEGTFTREGAKYITSYYPLKKEEVVYAVLSITKKLYFPEI